MSQISENNRRIARNSLMLYFRMFIMLIIGLFTSRITLQALGVDNYGINNVVGGVVGMFSLVTGALINSVNRFLTFVLGRKDDRRLNEVFCTAMNVMIMLSMIVLILGETVGLWFLYNKLNIAPDRLGAANVVLQCSIAMCIMNLLYIPYNSLIIAYEKMSVWAYFSILDVVVKLLVVYALYISPFDKLKTYALLLLAWSVLNQIIYRIYCHRTFKVARYHFVLDKPLLKQVFSFAGWNFFGQGACIINNQGVNIVINLFFGVAVNAARGIANTVNGYVIQFAGNFMTAINPQITKSFAAGDYDECHKLIYRGTKFSYFLMLFLALPIWLEADTILRLWLGQVPEHTVTFIRWVLVITVVNYLSSTLIVALHASGKLKRYMTWVGLVEISNFPLTYLAFWLGMPPAAAYWVFAGVYLVLMFLRLYLIKDKIYLSAREYMKAVYLRVFPVTLVAAALPGFVCLVQEDSFWRLLEVGALSVVTTPAAAYFLGLTRHEREKVTETIKSRISRR